MLAEVRALRGACGGCPPCRTMADVTSILFQLLCILLWGGGWGTKMVLVSAKSLSFQTNKQTKTKLHGHISWLVFDVIDDDEDEVDWWMRTMGDVASSQFQLLRNRLWQLESRCALRQPRNQQIHQIQIQRGGASHWLSTAACLHGYNQILTWRCIHGIPPFSVRSHWQMCYHSEGSTRLLWSLVIKPRQSGCQCDHTVKHQFCWKLCDPSHGCKYHQHSSENVATSIDASAWCQYDWHASVNSVTSVSASVSTCAGPAHDVS